jgi:hypothetical protein
MIFSLLAAAALFIAFSNGPNDNFKSFATFWGSASLLHRTALILFTVRTDPVVMEDRTAGGDPKCGSGDATGSAFLTAKRLAELTRTKTNGQRK